MYPNTEITSTQASYLVPGSTDYHRPPCSRQFLLLQCYSMEEYSRTHIFQHVGRQMKEREGSGPGMVALSSTAGSV
jgi:hypothetical protein